MSGGNIRQAAQVLRQYLAGHVSYTVAQQRVTGHGFRLDDPALAAELQRQDAEQQAEAEAAEARRRRQGEQVNAYIRREHERTRGITITDSDNT
jgi:hypothetical protein